MVAVRRLARRLRRDEGGAVLVVVAASLVLIFGCGALAVDVGSWYQRHRQAQAAADAAALAAAQDLPANPATAVSDGQSYVSKNIDGATVTVTTPYGGSSTEVHVTVSVPGALWFGKLLGISAPTISASATAEINPAYVHYMFFAYDDVCADQSMLINGENNNVEGGAHSNGMWFEDGNNDTFGYGSYGGPNGCTYLNNAQHVSIGSGTTPLVDPLLEPWPLDYSKMSIPCTYSAASFTFNTNGATLSPGVYCATGQISINANNLSGNVSFVGGSFLLGGNNESFTPYFDNLTIYQTGTGALTINGNNYVNLGTVFAPNALVLVNGNNGTTTGFVEGLDIKLNANNNTFIGAGPIVSGSPVSLIQ